MLELDGLGFAYRPGRWVFRDVGLVLPAGTVTAVLGPNGVGKTTLLRCAAGLLDAQEGSVQRNGPTSFVPQAHDTTFGYRVLDMVLMGRARHVGTFSVPGRADRFAASAALARVGLSDLADRPFPTLSGGERQLVLVARALASGSEVLILDEPASMLDLRNQGEVLTMLRDLADDGMAILLSTHHPDHALYAAHQAVLMSGPGDLRVGDAGALLTDHALSVLYRVPVRTVTYDADGVTRRVVATSYDGPLLRGGTYG